MRLAARFGAAFAFGGMLAGVVAFAGSRDIARHGPPPESLTRAQADEIVRAHNQWRRRAGVLPVRWAADLAAQAQSRARQLASTGCIIEHGALPDNVGENLYRAGPLRASNRKDEILVVSPSEVIYAWGAESADYSHAKDACAPNRQCGHYTQIVWPSTEEVGCGMAVCPSLGQVWACRYRPRGNVRVIR
jgi:pathogenesis-related protein 1